MLYNETEYQNSNKIPLIYSLKFAFCIRKYINFTIPIAKVAQLVEHNLPKVGVAGSSPVFRSKKRMWRNGSRAVFRWQ